MNLYTHQMSDERTKSEGSANCAIEGISVATQVLSNDILAPWVQTCRIVSELLLCGVDGAKWQFKLM